MVGGCQVMKEIEKENNIRILTLLEAIIYLIDQNAELIEIVNRTTSSTPPSKRKLEGN